MSRATPKTQTPKKPRNAVAVVAKKVKSPVKKKAVIGRPTLYTAELADRICTAIANGKAGGIAAKEAGITHTTLYEWLKRYPTFADKYVRAREDQADFYADQIVAIADELTIEARHQGEDVILDVSSTAVARNRLRVDARKWYASKLAPKKYGDKLESVVTGADGGPIQHSVKIKFV